MTPQSTHEVHAEYREISLQPLAAMFEHFVNQGFIASDFTQLVANTELLDVWCEAAKTILDRQFDIHPQPVYIARDRWVAVAPGFFALHIRDTLFGSLIAFKFEDEADAIEVELNKLSWSTVTDNVQARATVRGELQIRRLLVHR